MCILSTLITGSLTTALTSAIGAAGSAAAETVVAGIVGGTIGAADGALMGVATSAITGNDIGRGALMGAATGAVTGGVLNGAGTAISNAGGIPIPGTDIVLGAKDVATGTGNIAQGSPQAGADIGSNMTEAQIEAIETGGYEATLNSVGNASIDNAANGLTNTASNAASNSMDLSNAFEIAELGTSGGQAATESQLNTAYQTISDSAKGVGSNGVEKVAEESVKSGFNWGKIGLAAAGVGTSLYGSYIGAQTAVDTAEAEAREAEGKADQADIQAGIHDMKQNAETAAAAEEKAQLAKRRRMLVGKGKTAAASNGVMLETRAESSPAMFEQDAAAEMAYEQGKVDYNLRIKNSIHGANAALSRMSAANYREQGAYAKRLGNLKSTTSWISGIANSATGLASAFM